MQLIRHDLLKLNCIDIQDYNLDYWISKIVKIVSTFFLLVITITTMIQVS